MLLLPQAAVNPVNCSHKSNFAKVSMFLLLKPDKIRLGVDVIHVVYSHANVTVKEISNTSDKYLFFIHMHGNYEATLATRMVLKHLTPTWHLFRQ